MTDSIKRSDSIRFHGITGRYNEKLIRKFLVDLPERDPMVLKMFTARDRRPLRHLLGWSGEFAGKYLTSCGYAYRISGDEELKSTAVSLTFSPGTATPDPKTTGSGPNMCGIIWTSMG